MASLNEYRSYPDGGQPHPETDRGVTTYRHGARGFQAPPLVVWRPLPAERGNVVSYGEGLGVIRLMEPQHHYKMHVLPMLPSKCSGWLMVEDEDVEVCSGWLLEGSEEERAEAEWLNRVENFRDRWREVEEDDDVDSLREWEG